MRLKKKILDIESKRWVSDGIIDRSQADKILALYPEEKPRNWGVLVFSSVGAILFGLGVILLFAYNWDKINRLVKLGIVVCALLSAHGLGFLLRSIKEGKFSGFSEGLFALGTMLFGAGIWLVAQAYHIDEHYPNAFFIWGIGALLLGWSLRSSTQAMMASVIFTIWCGSESLGFKSPPHLIFAIILFGIVPLAVIKRSNFLLAVTVATFLICLLMDGIELFENNLDIVFLSVGACLIATSILAKRGVFFPESHPVLMIAGNICYWPVLSLLTFPHICSELLVPRYDGLDYVQMIYLVGFIAVALISWAFVILPISKLKAIFEGASLRPDHLAIPITLVTVSFNFGLLSFNEGVSGAIFFNAIYLFQSISLIHYGCKHSCAAHTVLGTLLLAVLSFAKYADLFHSLLARGAVFLAVGAGIFFIGMRYTKNKERKLT